MLGNKGQKGGAMWPIVVLVVAALFIFYPQISGLFPAAKPSTTTTETTEPGYVCPVEKTTLGMSAVNVDDPGTQVGVNARYWIEDLPKGIINASSADIEVSPGDKLKVWFAAGDTTYYGSLFNDKSTVPCKGTYDIAGKLWTQDGSVSMTVFDEYDNAQTGAANNQTLGIGETVELKLRVKGNYQKYYGNPEVSLDNVLTLEYTATEIDSVKVTKDGVELKSASVPVVETVSSTANKEIGFAMPKIAGSANVDYYLVIKADDINDPSNDIYLKIYDADYFYNSITGKIDSGWEDQNNNDIGETTEPTATVYLS